jgi:hypothetical protein
VARLTEQHGRTLDAIYVEPGVSGGVAFSERPEGGKLWAELRKGIAQTSNAYWLTPERETLAFACDMQTARAVKLVMIKKAAVEVERVAPEVRDEAIRALATIRARRMAVLGLA